MEGVRKMKIQLLSDFCKKPLHQTMKKPMLKIECIPSNVLIWEQLCLKNHCHHSSFCDKTYIFLHYIQCEDFEK